MELRLIGPVYVALPRLGITGGAACAEETAYVCEARNWSRPARLRVPLCAKVYLFDVARIGGGDSSSTANLVP
ncbi:hypothetical protein BURKHO8Y_580032 [Burkholderia sp. 8Y]|nr:hypothetical protein BURKHO8Y_580032 [Burkholderia sp. 8Y]